MFTFCLTSVPSKYGNMLDKPDHDFSTKEDAEEYATIMASLGCYGHIWDHSKTFWENQA